MRSYSDIMKQFRACLSHVKMIPSPCNTVPSIVDVYIRYVIICAKMYPSCNSVHMIKYIEVVLLLCD